MINLILNGVCGHMGRTIVKEAEQREDCRVVCGFDPRTCEDFSFPVYQSFEQYREDGSVIIDFSHPSALSGILGFAKEKKLPIVIATTGLSGEQKQEISLAAKEIPVFFSANMSLGINLLIDLAKKAQAVLDGFDIEIIERHHNQKIDAPSGTALAIADALSEQGHYEYTYDRHARRQKRSPSEIGIHAVRGGTIVGDHTVLFAGKDEVIELHHSAASKEVFATGSIRAALFLVQKPAGLYSMEDLVNTL